MSVLLLPRWEGHERALTPRAPSPCRSSCPQPSLSRCVLSQLGPCMPCRGDTRAPYHMDVYQSAKKLVRDSRRRNWPRGQCGHHHPQGPPVARVSGCQASCVCLPYAASLLCASGCALSAPTARSHAPPQATRLGLSVEALGGGRIEHNQEQGTVKIYGYSSGCVGASTCRDSSAERSRMCLVHVLYLPAKRRSNPKAGRRQVSAAPCLQVWGCAARGERCAGAQVVPIVPAGQRVHLV